MRLLSRPHTMIGCLALVISSVGFADESPLTSEELAARLQEGILAVEVSYESSPGPASLLLARNRSCSKCHMPAESVTNPLLPGSQDAQRDIALSLLIQHTDQSAAHKGHGAAAEVVAGVVLDDGVTVIAHDVLRDPISKISARRSTGESVDVVAVARCRDPKLLVMRLTEPATGGLALSDGVPGPGSQGLAAIVTDESDLEVAGTMVASPERPAGSHGLQFKLDIRAAHTPAGTPVVDSRGRLTGLVVSDSDAPTSLVVAAPTVQAALSQVPDDTTEEVVSIRIPGPWIGIRLSDENEGIIVTEVYDGSPGATAGIAVGDRIVSVSGEPVHSANRFVARVRRLQIGDTLTLHCAHSDGTDTDLHIELAERPLPESQRPSGTTNTEPEGSSFCPAYPWPDTGDANAALLLYERAMANGFHDPAAATNPALQATAREAWMDAILEFHLLENGVTVVPPQKADSERLNKLAAQLDELAESLKAVSVEVKALRDAK